MKVPVNVLGVLIVINVFVMKGEAVYKLLLGRNWMHRVRCVHNYRNNTISIRGPDGKVR